MALAGFATLAQVFGAFKVASMVLDLDEALQSSRTQGGQIITDDVGARLWRAEVTLAPSRSSLRTGTPARLLLMREAARVFEVGPRGPMASPQADPGGTILGAATPVTGGFTTDRRDMQITGLPAGYVLTPGDYLSFPHGTGLHAFHMVVTGATASAGGVATVEVVPPVRNPVPVSQPVALVNPVFRASIVPGSVRVGAHVPGVAQGAAFSVVQNLRAVT